MGKEKQYIQPSWLIPDWEQGRITEEQWTPKPKTYDQATQNPESIKTRNLEATK